jgi:HPt (histidine-containing phosphotransfer) domain-containing protein
MLRELDAGDGLLAAIADEFDQDADRQVADLRAAIATADVPTVQRAAHTLKGASLNLGAVELGERCRQLELLAREGTVDGGDRLLDDVETELQRVQAALRQVVAGA